MKQIKEISRRSSSLWLILELILVTIACWWAFDPVLVSVTVKRMKPGYDVDRIVKLNVAGEQTTAVADEEELLLRQVQELEDVESAYCAAHTTPLGFGTIFWSNYYYHDSDSVKVYRHGFTKDSRMFEVYGIQSLTPEVPTSELTHDCEWEETVIITRSLAMGLFGTIDVAGRSVTGMEYGPLENGGYGWGKKPYRIRAVVEDVRQKAHDRDLAMVFLCTTGPKTLTPIIVRLREGVNAARFVESHKQQLLDNLTTEHCYIRDYQTARDAFREGFDRGTTGRRMRRNLFIAAFFSVNIAFGVLGTLLMYTRQRREEAGVKRAFGATRWSIFWGFIREAWLLATFSVIIGCIIYFQFASAKGLCDIFPNKNPAVRLWFDSFGTHFLVVSAFVYIIILCTVLLGTVLPAWRICRSTITEAIKEE
ncbi:MAG: ABC transporter permease [Bacteroidaceae bacterium]|nr:ABC transporter permease [Bacteroidaceae bacterium]